MAKRDQRQLYVHQLHPGLDRADSGRFYRLVGLFSVPAFPRFLGWITHLKDKPPIRAKRIVTRTKRCHPLLVRHEYLCHIASHGDEIGMQSFELRCSAGYPANSVARRFPSGDSKLGCSRIDANDLKPSRGEATGKRTGSASQVNDRVGTELVCYGQIWSEVRSVRTVEEVIDFGQFGLGKYGVRHHGNSPSLLFI